MIQQFEIIYIFINVLGQLLKINDTIRGHLQVNNICMRAIISINGTISWLLECCYILMARVNKRIAFERSNFKFNGPRQ